jgi:hypothetical protein
MPVHAFNLYGPIAKMVDRFKEDLLKELRNQENNYAQIIRQEVLSEVQDRENAILKRLENVQLDQRIADDVMKFLKLFAALDKNPKLIRDPKKLSELTGLNIEYTKVLVDVWRYGRIYEKIRSMKSSIVDMIAAGRLSIPKTEPNEATRKYF